MDQAQLQALIPPKQQNPLLKRKPLDLGTSFINYKQQNTIQTIDSPLYANEVTLLYFAAGWCNISKPFTKKLSAYYQEINLQYKKLQIIFVSFDKLTDQYQEHVRQMPWLGINFNDSRVAGLKEFYSITSIPTLILIDQNGQLISKQCRKDVYELGQDQAFQKWRKIKQNADLLM